MALTPHQRFGLELLESRQFMAIVTWDGGGGDHNWTNPLNWSGDFIPGITSDVVIPAGQPEIQLGLGAIVSIHSLASNSALRVNDGHLNVGGEMTQHAAFALLNGNLSALSILFDGDVDWTGGSIGGPATLTAGHGLIIDGDVQLTGSLDNYGLVDWRSGTIFTVGSMIPFPEQLPTIINRPGRTFLMNSGGAITSLYSANFVNFGTVIRDGAPSATTTIAIAFDNYGGPYPLDGIPQEPGTVEVRSGTLSFTNSIFEKDGSTLFGTSRWIVSSSSARLLMPGPDITTATGTIILNGAGASFPALEHAVSIDNLTLSGGRAWTFTNVDPHLYTMSSLTIDNPGMITTIPSLRATSLTVRGGRVDILDGLEGQIVTVNTGTVLVLDGISRLPYAQVSGAGLIRVKGELDWPSGTIAGPGQLVITETGHFTTTGQYYEYFDKLLTRRVINRGTMDLSESTHDFRFSGEIANRGVLNLSIQGFLSTSLGISTGSAPGFITNLGIINSYASLTLRGASGAIRLNNQGTVHVASGALILNGGSYGGGNWVVDLNAELVFGGFGSILVNATFSGAGRIREAAAAWWTNPIITGTGDMVITVPGKLALLGTFTSITRRSITNNGLIYLHEQTNTNVHADVINNAEFYAGTGVFNITGNMTLSSASSITVRSPSPGVWPLRFNVSGAIDINGALNVVFSWPAGFGTNFDFLSAGPHSGTFSSITATGNDPGTIPFFFFVGNFGRVNLAIF